MVDTAADSVVALVEPRRGAAAGVLAAAAAAAEAAEAEAERMR